MQPPASENSLPVDVVEKSFVVQKFARLHFPKQQFSLLGYSVAGEETVLQVPELNVCFDIGRSPQFALTSDFICITHSHMDHIAGLGYYLSQRAFQGMKPGTILLPREIERPVDALLRSWRDVERQGTPYQLVPMTSGQTFEVRRDFGIRAFATHHGGASLGYALISVREKLLPEYAGLTGPQLVELKKQNVEIQYRVEVPLVAFLGDTTAGNIFDQPDIQNAHVLVTELTFFEKTHHGKAKAGKHLHLDQFVELLAKLKNEHIVIGHVSRRTGLRHAKSLLRKRIGDDAMQRIHFLMDFEGAADAGEIEGQSPDQATE